MNCHRIPSLFLLAALHLLPQAATAASAVAFDLAAHKFGYCHARSTVEEAKQCALSNCTKAGGQNCRITDTGTKGGYSAIAAGSGQIGTFLSSAEDEEMVNARAVWDCEQKATGCDYTDIQAGQCKIKASCKVVAKWKEPEQAGPPPSSDMGRQAQGQTAPGQVKSLIDEGNALFREKRFGEAISAYTQAIDANPNAVAAWFNRGLANENLGPANYAAAVDDFSKALSLNPRHEHALFQRGMLYRKAGQEQAYLADMQAAANLGNDKAQAQLNAAAQRDAPRTPNPGQQGLSQAQASQGCINRGNVIECPRAPQANHANNAGQASENSGATPSASMFGHDWHLHVPGAAYQTDNVVDGTRTLHVSAGSGALPHVLNISADGTYRWTAYGKVIEGRWVKGDREYPVVLQNAYDGKSWKAVTGNGEILLWDGQSLAGQFKGK